MARSIWKGPYMDNYLWKWLRKAKKIEDNNNNNKLIIWSRRSQIFPEIVGKTCQIYNGKNWINLKINEEKVGHLFGEFLSSKKIAQYKRKKK